MNKIIEMLSGRYGISSARVFTAIMVIGAFIEWMHEIFIGSGIWNPSVTTVTIIIGAMGNNVVQKKLEKNNMQEKIQVPSLDNKQT